MIDLRTQEIISIFQQSWLETKSFYEGWSTQSDYEVVKPYVEFIDQMISNGEYRNFRAGSFMDGFSLSRSVNFQLRDDQKYILVEYPKNGYFQVSLREGRKEYRSYKIPGLNDERFLKLVATLKHTLAD